MKQLPARGYYIEAPRRASIWKGVTPEETMTKIVWWSGDRKGSYFWSSAHKKPYVNSALRYGWSKSPWAESIGTINRRGTLGPLTFEELTAVVENPSYEDTIEYLDVLGRAPGDDS